MLYAEASERRKLNFPRLSTVILCVQFPVILTRNKRLEIKSVKNRGKMEERKWYRIYLSSLAMMLLVYFVYTDSKRRRDQNIKQHRGKLAPVDEKKRLLVAMA